MTKEEFIEKLKKNHRAPYLFVGSGFTRHYFGSPDWNGILQMFAENHINQYKSTLNTDDLPTIASEIAKEANANFWKLPEDDPFKVANKSKADVQSNVLKIKIAEYFQNLSKKEFPEEYREEVDLLSKLNIEGVITTNWDNTMERIFESYKTYIGQKDLITAPTFNIAEIYKIHGCMTKPESLVLTKEDYDDFEGRNPYLAAKLITLFVEHPIVFIGYSITDNYIQNILKSIVECLGKDDVSRLQNNLIFVEWNEKEDTDMQIDKHDISLSNGAILPVTRIKTHNFKPVYECMSCYESKIPKHLLRLFKESFYDILISDKPEKTIMANINQIDENKDIEFVVGYGLIKQKSYVGLTVDDLMRDVVYDNCNYIAKRVLEDSIPNMKGVKKSSFIPVYKYMSELGIKRLEDLKNKKLKKCVTLRKDKDFASYPSFSKSEKQKTLEDAIDTYRTEIWKAIALIPYLKIEDSDLDDLCAFIAKHYSEFLEEKNVYATYMRKLICFYDWRKYGVSRE